jgi:hypothetical protein
MTTPTIIMRPYLVFPGTAQAAAFNCEHEWRNLEEGEDNGLDFVAVAQGRLSTVRACKHCVALLLAIEGHDGKSYGHLAMRDAPERESASAE